MNNDTLQYTEIPEYLDLYDVETLIFRAGLRDDSNDFDWEEDEMELRDNFYSVAYGHLDDNDNDKR